MLLSTYPVNCAQYRTVFIVKTLPPTVQHRLQYNISKMILSFTSVQNYNDSSCYLEYDSTRTL